MLAIRPFAVVNPKAFLFKATTFPLPLSSLFLTKPSNQFSHFSTLTSLNSLPYGPSLLKGKTPSQVYPQSLNLSNEETQQNPDGFSEDELIKEENFTRVFDISALRVPKKDCFLLESRLRGHLLNWPRIRNVARVPGDEVDEEMVSLLGERNSGSEDEGGIDAKVLERRIFGRAEGDGDDLNPVLYRERLAKAFNARGFVKFRNLARISRPKKKRKGGKEERVKAGDSSKEKNGFAVVEVFGEEEEGDDWKGLLGDEGRRRRWKGSTRLLLLDERYAGKEVEELPQAIKAALQDSKNQTSASMYELVKCKLTLFYDYWQMDEILGYLLPKGMVIPSAYETAGHIAHLNLRDEHLPYKNLIAKVVLDKNRPKIQTVVNKIDVIHNEYRTMPLEVLAGNHSLVTTVVENGVRFHIDFATVYWNSRHATERQRLISCFTRDDVLCLPY